jgi:gliding motility-associated-like protein
MCTYINGCVFAFLSQLVCASLFCQNLVPNPGFDEITDCPNDWNQVHYAEPWYNPSNGYPAVFNACSTEERFAVPYAGISSVLSYMEPRSGDGYAHLRPYRNVVNGVVGYIATPLIKPLEENQNYYIEYYVIPDHPIAIGYEGFSDAIGLAFTEEYHYEEIENQGALKLNPAIENRGKLIKDTLNWTRISGCYRAGGWEAHAIIGNFRTTSETLFETNRPHVNGHDVYMYIEDVLIHKVDPLPDTVLLCRGDRALEFSVDSLGQAGLLWNDGSTDRHKVIDQPGMYTVDVFFEHCTIRDTLIVLEYDILAENIRDSVVVKCSDETIDLEAGIPGAYVWSTGDTTRQINVRTNGTYEVTVVHNCGVLDQVYHVEDRSCGCFIYIPDAFTPNGDGLNDELEVFAECDFILEFESLRIFDRWGGLVFETSDVARHGWKGEGKDGKPDSADAYVWELIYRVDGEIRRESGHVQLLR